MTQKELKKLFEETAEKNGKFNISDSEWNYDCDETYLFQDNKIYRIERDNYYKYNGNKEYTIKEIKPNDSIFNNRMFDALEYIKLFNAYGENNGVEK